MGTAISIAGGANSTSPAACSDNTGTLELPGHEFLSDLASNDPEAYEALRRDLIDAFINSAPQRLTQRLKGIQFRVDGVRQLAGSSGLGATLRIYNLMWESFLCLNDNWQEFVRMERTMEEGRDAWAEEVPPQRSAAVLQFPPLLRDSRD